MGKVTGSANSDTGRSELSNNFVIWKTLRSNALALAAARSSRCCSWSTWSQYWGAMLGMWRGGSRLWENPPVPQTGCHSPPSSVMLFPVVCFQQVQFSLLNQAVSVTLNIGDVSFHEPQLEATECKKSSFKVFFLFCM